MKVSEITEYLLHIPSEKRAPTCDGLLVGTDNKEVKTLAVTFMLTLEVLERAIAAGADMIVTHEPIYYGKDIPPQADDPVTARRKHLLEDTGIAVFRYHDHAHLASPDFIHAGFMRTVDLGWDPDFYTQISLGVAQYQLLTPLSVREICQRIRQKLGVTVKYMGNLDARVKKLALGLGSTDIGYTLLRDTDTNLFIGGEMHELLGGEYARDAAYMNLDKCLLALGHYGSEYAGMRYLSEYLKANLDGVSVFFADGKEVFGFYEEKNVTPCEKQPIRPIIL